MISRASHLWPQIIRLDFKFYERPFFPQIRHAEAALELCSLRSCRHITLVWRHRCVADVPRWNALRRVRVECGPDERASETAMFRPGDKLRNKLVCK